MNNILVLYRSKYGATEQYAHMLAGELPCELLDTARCRARTLKAGIENCGRVVLAGGVYAGGIAGLDILRKNFGSLKEKKPAVFCVGASPLDEAAIRALKARQLTGELVGIPLFYGRGAWDESRMHFPDRTLCRLLQKSLAKKDAALCEPWMQELLCAAGEKHDWTDRRYLLPLVRYLREDAR